MLSCLFCHVVGSILDFPGVVKKFGKGATHAVTCTSDEEVRLMWRSRDYRFKCVWGIDIVEAVFSHNQKMLRHRNFRSPENQIVRLSSILYIVSFDRTCVILGCWDSQYTILSERFSPKLHLIWRLKANSPLVMITKNSSFTILQDIDIHFFQVVSGAVKIMESSDIVWTHLHEAEMFFKGKRNLIQRLILVW